MYFFYPPEGYGVFGTITVVYCLIFDNLNLMKFIFPQYPSSFFQNGVLISLFFFASCSSEDVVEEQVTKIENNFIPLFACENGTAGPYPCSGYDLIAHIPASTLGGNSADANDSWGWEDPETGKEYAIIGTTTGTAFVDISNPVEPVILGRLPSATGSSPWRDIKVYKDHAFIVSEAENHGMQIFDLKRLRNTSTSPQNFTADARYTGFGNAHNIVINENTGFAYVVGSKTYEGGPHFINIQSPGNPVAAGGYAEEHYTHDAQVVTYNGPDMDYSGREIFIGSNHDGVVLVDVTDKSNPVFISKMQYNNLGYPHQGWFTEDLRYFLAGDEFDETQFGYNTRTVVIDFIDLDNPTVHLEYLGPTKAIDHNGYVHNKTFYLANYTAGVRIIDVADLGMGIMEETGFFDTYPAHNQSIYEGVWNVYPYFESGNIVLSDIKGGLFIIRKSTD